MIAGRQVFWFHSKPFIKMLSLCGKRWCQFFRSHKKMRFIFWSLGWLTRFFFCHSIDCIFTYWCKKRHQPSTLSTDDFNHGAEIGWEWVSKSQNIEAMIISLDCYGKRVDPRDQTGGAKITILAILEGSNKQEMYDNFEWFALQEKHCLGFILKTPP